MPQLVLQREASVLPSVLLFSGIQYQKHRCSLSVLTKILFRPILEIISKEKRNNNKGLQYLHAACLIKRRIKDKLFRILIYFGGSGSSFAFSGFLIVVAAGSTLGCTMQALGTGSVVVACRLGLLCGLWNLARPEMEPHVPFIGRWIPNQWTTREVQDKIYIN